MRARRWSQACAVELPARLEAVDAACAEVRQFLTGQPVVSLFKIMCGLREALLNAVIHGSGLDPRQWVHCQVEVVNGGVVCRVRDQGAGFAWRPLLHGPPPDPGTLSGRGLPLMRACFAHVDYNDAGNEILLRQEGVEREVDMDQRQTGKLEVLVRPEGDIVASSIEQLRSELLTLMAGSPRRLVVDLSAVQVIDSLGMSLLVATHNSLRQAGGSLVVRHASRDVYELLTIMRLHKHFEVQPPAEGANDGG